MAPPYIPDDLIFSILARLPAKSVIRFRCVSRAWLVMTSSKTFVDAHLGFSKASPMKLIVPGERFQRRGPKTPLCLEFYKYKGGKVAELVHGLDIPGEFSARAPPLHCDGLILTFTRDQDIIMVCNPATREFLALPKGTHGGVGDQDQLVGFGRDPCSNKYKVARFFYQRELGTSQVECKFEVLTLGTNVWSRTVDPPRLILDMTPAHVGGFIYWRPRRPSFKFFVRFSLADETFCQVPYPPCEAPPLAFVELDDHELSCACVAQPYEVIEVWTCTYTDDMPAWTRRCIFRLPQENAVPGPGGSMRLPSIFCGRKGLYFSCGDGCYHCDIVTGVTKKVPVVAFKDYLRYYHPEKGTFKEYTGEEVVFYSLNYAESLVQITEQVVPPTAAACSRKRKKLSWVPGFIKTVAGDACEIIFLLLLLAGLRCFILP